VERAIVPEKTLFRTFHGRFYSQPHKHPTGIWSPTATKILFFVDGGLHVSSVRSRSLQKDHKLGITLNVVIVSSLNRRDSLTMVNSFLQMDKDLPTTVEYIRQHWDKVAAKKYDIGTNRIFSV
jgi:hypothetical protein